MGIYSSRVLTGVLIFLLMFGSISVFQFQSVEGSPLVSAEDIMTGFFQPRIDGFLDIGAPLGFLNEWEDAHLTLANISYTDNSTMSLSIFTKHVGSNLYVAFEHPLELAMIAIQIDRDNDRELSDGDIRLTLENRSLSISVISGSNSMSLGEYLSLDSTQEGLITTEIGSIGQGFVTNKTHVEIRVSEIAMDTYLGNTSLTRVNNQFSQLNYGIIMRTADGRLAGFPENPFYIEDELWTDTVYLAEYLFSQNMYLICQSGGIDGVDICIDHIEVTQAVQTPNNDRRLVAGKKSLARVFVDGPAGEEVQVDLHAYVEGYLAVYEIGMLSQVYTVPSSLDRTVLSNSANFLLPDDWHSFALWPGVPSRLILTANVYPVDSVDIEPVDEWDGISFQFYETHDLVAYYILTNEYTTAQPIILNEEMIKLQMNITSATYPVAHPVYFELPWTVMGAMNEQDYASSNDEEVLAHLTEIALAFKISAEYLESQGQFGLLPIPDQIYAFRHSGCYGISDPIWGEGASFAAFGPGNWRGFHKAFAHEMGHNLGPNTTTEQWGMHIPGGGLGQGSDDIWISLYGGEDNSIHDLGWSPFHFRYYEEGLGSLVPSDTPDFMSYDYNFPDKPENWISEYRWERMLDRFRNFIPGEPAHPAHTSPGPLSDFVLAIDTMNSTVRIVQGFLNIDGSARLLPSFEIPGLPTEPVPRPRENPRAYLRVVYENDTYSDTPLVGHFTKVNGSLRNDSLFSLVLEDNGLIRTLSIIDATDNSTLAFYNDTQFTGSAEILSPPSIPRGSYSNVIWNLSLSNSSMIYSRLQYSPDGLRFYPIGGSTTGTSRNVTLDGLPGGENAQFRLLLSDGVRTQIFDGPTFSVSNLQPTLILSEGTPPLQVTTGSSYSLSTRGYDPEAGELDNDAFVWKISKDQTLISQTSGKILSTHFFEPGTYQVTITAIDPDGLNATENIDIEVLPPAYLNQSTWTSFKDALDAFVVDALTPDITLILVAATGFVIVVIVLFFYYRRMKFKR